MADHLIGRGEQKIEARLGNKETLTWRFAENRLDPQGVSVQTGFMQGAAGIGSMLIHFHITQEKGRTSPYPFYFPDNPFT
jgi:hypothetical protein